MVDRSQVKVFDIRAGSSSCQSSYSWSRIRIQTNKATVTQRDTARSWTRAGYKAHTIPTSLVSLKSKLRSHRSFFIAIQVYYNVAPITSATMSSAPLKPLKFYDIAFRAPRKETNTAPNPWKARLALNFKALPYVTTWVPLPDVEKVRRNLQVPACRKFGDGSATTPCLYLKIPTPATSSVIPSTLRCICKRRTRTQAWICSRSRNSIMCLHQTKHRQFP